METSALVDRAGAAEPNLVAVIMGRLTDRAVSGGRAAR